MWCRFVPPCAAGALVICAITPRASAIISSNPAPYQGVTINTFIGADRFYDAGFLGQSAVVANIEGGFVWNQHETLTQVTTFFNDPSITGQFDAHATAVGQTIAGEGSLFYHQAGIAPFANLWSGAIATGFGPGGSFFLSDASFATPYLMAMKTGVNGLGTADVINSSWGDASELDGNGLYTLTIDALAAATGKTVVLAAGNSGPGADTVGSPASGFNAIVVGALGSDTSNPQYGTPSNFSSRGPNDVFIPIAADGSAGVTLKAKRAPVDLAAPGENLIVAYYGGATGSNSGGIDTSNGATNFYSFNAAGTSFAAPIVAGGAALLVDAAHSYFPNDDKAVDGRVIKAVLMNAADKTVGWDNGQSLVGGVVRTTQALDYATGAGRVDLSK
ncbi:MAG TPA: S8 family serine peptidase, partial [Tepidisphaeraceae bacterium]|nr:S8 family serine peptidase [Tepidisphaeraceae bacterium]